MGKNGNENIEADGQIGGGIEHTIPITVDKKPYKVRDPISGNGLYRFLAIGPEYDLYLEVRGRRDDVLVPRTDTTFDLKPGDHLYTAQASLNPGGCEALLQERPLPTLDYDYLQDKEINYSCELVNGKVHLKIQNYEMPQHYTTRFVELLIIIPPGYPNAQLDMFYTSPDVKLLNGNWPLKADHHENFNGISWQRWSRHLNTGWRVGVDSLKTFLRGIEKEIAKAV